MQERVNKSSLLVEIDGEIRLSGIPVEKEPHSRTDELPIGFTCSADDGWVIRTNQLFKGLEEFRRHVAEVHIMHSRPGEKIDNPNIVYLYPKVTPRIKRK